MNEMNRWTFWASLFFSVSLCGTAYDVVQGSVQLAGAGNPQAMERTLTDFVGRMGGANTADLPAAPVAVAKELAFAAKAEKQELEPLADFLIAQGKDKTLDASIAAALGYSGTQNLKQRGWQTDDNMKHFSALNSDNNTDIILAYQNPESVGYIWLTDRSGKLKTTLKVGNGQAIKVPNSEASDQFKAQKEYFKGKVPPAEAAATEPGTN